LPAKPDWAQTTQDFWAPSLLYDGSKYFMYYSATPDECREGPDHALAVATSDSPAGPFVDMAVFVDAGSVASRFDGLDLGRLHTSHGIGLSFHTPSQTALRVELARSREGLGLVFSFSPRF